MSKYDTTGEKPSGTTAELADTHTCDHCRAVVEMRESPHGRAWCPDCGRIQRGEGQRNDSGLEDWALEFSSLGAGGRR